MKKIIVLVSLLSSVNAMAAFTAKLDCSKAQAGEVTMTDTKREWLKDEKYTPKEAAMLAYNKCFVKEGNAIVQEARTKAIQESQAIEPGENCGGSTGDLEISTLMSWEAGKFDISTSTGVEIGTMIGDSTFAVRENFECFGVGTGMFGGVNASSVVNLEVKEIYTYNFQTKATKQVYTVKVLKK